MSQNFKKYIFIKKNKTLLHGDCITQNTVQNTFLVWKISDTKIWLPFGYHLMSQNRPKQCNAHKKVLPLANLGQPTTLDALSQQIGSI